MFRRTKTEEPAATVTVKESGKGRPTRSRREAEEENRARAKGPRDKKDRARAQRSKRAEQSARMREAMKTGDERYLPARDKGPVRRYIRDMVDARLCMAELLLPLLVLIMVSQAISPQLSSDLWIATILLVGADTVLVVFKLRRELSRRFPGDARTRGATGYAIMRSIQVRWLRMPKPQVKLGQKLPERYT
ncbi:MAG TPA: DUF3043 domain-containing protein [Nocardioidaceae bacterium]|nr:DUF3043 domain-containing protein [Nocardioidaceae bacterium]